MKHETARLGGQADGNVSMEEVCFLCSISYCERNRVLIRIANGWRNAVLMNCVVIFSAENAPVEMGRCSE